MNYHSIQRNNPDITEASEVISVLMYLFKNHMQNTCELDLPVEDLVVELEEQGFEDDAIGKAFDWLEAMQELQSADMQYTLINHQARRVYTAQELAHIDQASLAFLADLCQKNIVTPVDHEAIINLSLLLEINLITLPITKWIVMMVLFNNPNSREALAHVEALVLNETESQEAH